MFRKHRLSAFICVGIIAFSACNRIPDHARYIPKDATMALSIDVKSLSKKIMWSALTNSDFFKKLKQHLPDTNANDAVSSLAQAGIDGANTFYAYIKSDKRFSTGNRYTVLIPLGNASQWEVYIKKTFPAATISQHGEHREASLGRDIYAGWNKNLLILINTIRGNDYMASEDNSPAQQSEDNNADVSAEMDKAFHVTKENELIGNKHFTDLEKNGHDITLWMNYDQLMSQYMSSDFAAKTGGVSLSSNLWKDAAMASGFDFRKGKIAGVMQFYASDDMKEIFKELGRVNADKEMIEMMPAQNLDMLMTYHLSPKGLKTILDKSGMLGLANLALTSENISADYILDAFTGDMAYSINDLSVKKEARTDTSMSEPHSNNTNETQFKMTYALKINKKENFLKLMELGKEALAATEIGMQPLGNNGYVIPLGATDSVFVMYNDQYAVISNKGAYAMSFIQGTFKNDKKPVAVSSDVIGHPMSIYVDMQEILKNVELPATYSTHDSTVYAESKKLLENIIFTGGEYKDNAAEAHLDINFMNKDENSILELLEFAMQVGNDDKNKTSN